MCRTPTEWGERDPDKEKESKLTIQYAAASEKKKKVKWSHFFKVCVCSFLTVLGLRCSAWAKLNGHIFKSIYVFTFDREGSSLLCMGFL